MATETVSEAEFLRIRRNAAKGNVQAPRIEDDPDDAALDLAGRTGVYEVAGMAIPGPSMWALNALADIDSPLMSGQMVDLRDAVVGLYVLANPADVLPTISLLARRRQLAERLEGKAHESPAVYERWLAYADRQAEMLATLTTEAMEWYAAEADPHCPPQAVINELVRMVSDFHQAARMAYPEMYGEAGDDTGGNPEGN